MKYYKVVKRRGRRLFSLMYAFLPLRLRVEYLPGVWVAGELGPLFIFYSKSTAERFRIQFGIYSQMETWEVEVENPRNQETVLSCGRLVQWAISDQWDSSPDKNKLEQRLKWFFEKKMHFNGLPSVAPIGTMVADKVKLVRRVSK